MKKLNIALTLTVVILAASIPVRAYVIAISRAGTGEIVQHKWKSPAAFPIRWEMNPVQGANVTGSRTQAQVFEASFASWQAVSTASVSFVRGNDTDAGKQQGADNINLVTTNPNSGTGLPAGVLALTFGSVYDGPGFDPTLGRTIDFAGQIAEADIVFSSTVPFSTSATAVPGRIDLEAVMTHEVGHLLGLDHSPIVSASMFWSVASGIIYPRNLSTDDMAAISLLYPAGSPAKGKISGFVRAAGTGSPVYGAVVVAVNANGNPVASAVTDPAGAYTIEGLDAGAYTVYAEPLDGPITISNISSLQLVYPGSSANTNFSTRFR